MCGICGIYNYKTGEPADERLVRAMTDTMIHRGPDDSGFHFDGSLGLGMRRLSIIDLAGGAQPISNENGALVTVSNGEVYNYRELRRELEACGHTFRTRSDTEVIVHAYEQWGLEALGRFNGMFGLAIWDRALRQLVLARDPFGVKPLYWWDDGKTLLFASEIRAILRHPAVEAELDLRALDQFLSLRFVPSPRTAFKRIGKLGPGHCMVCTSWGAETRRFHMSIPQTLMECREDDLIRELQGTIAAAVKRQMVSDVPVGVMLSGGTDSSTVATIMSELVGRPIDTFTVGFEGNFSGNELEKARAAAARIGSNHHEVVVSASEYAKFLPESIEYLEEPIATTSTLAFYKVCRLAREHVKVVLTGQGADEPFAGYPRHLGERYGSLYRAIPSPLREKLLARMIHRLPRNERAKRAVGSLDLDDPVQRLATVYAIVDASLKRSLYADGLALAQDGDEAVRMWQSDVAHLDGLSQMLYVDARFSLPDNLLLYADKMAMAVSLEARVPFLDLDLMRLAESIPPGLKIRGKRQKQILKKAISKWVPREVLDGCKVGFDTPIDGWLRRELRSEIGERLLSEGSACRRYFRSEAVWKILDDHLRGRHDYKRILFSLLTFEIWHEQFIKPAAKLRRVA